MTVHLQTAASSGLPHLQSGARSQPAVRLESCPRALASLFRPQRSVDAGVPSSQETAPWERPDRWWRRSSGGQPAWGSLRAWPQEMDHIAAALLQAERALAKAPLDAPFIPLPPAVFLLRDYLGCAIGPLAVERARLKEQSQALRGLAEAARAALRDLREAGEHVVPVSSPGRHTMPPLREAPLSAPDRQAVLPASTAVPLARVIRGTTTGAGAGWLARGGSRS